MQQVPDPPADPQWWLRRLSIRLEVDRAVFYALAARAWQLIAGPVTLVLIAVYFTPEVQGYFYTFGSLLALQTFVELGLHVVLITLSSHEWARLELDARGRPVGDETSLARLGSLARRSVRWYGGAALVFMLAVGGFGLLFFGQAGEAVAWQIPWCVLVVLTGLSLWLLPLIAVLEGCNQVVAVQRMRVVQGVTGNLAIWAVIPLGVELWAAVAVAGVKLGWEAWLVFIRYGAFSRALAFGTPPAETVDWRNEVWPLQWRMSVQALFGYFGYSLFAPVMFHYHGAAEAGRMGMTWTILLSLHAAGLAWVQTRMPRFGMLVSLRDFAELDRLFVRVTTVSAGVVATGGALFFAAVAGLSLAAEDAAGSLPSEIVSMAERLSDRLLPPLPTALFALAVVLLHVPHCQALYVRAHRIDPFLWISPLTNLAIGLLVWQVGGRFGPTGAGLGYVAVIALATVPGYWTIWRRCRRDLH